MKKRSTSSLLLTEISLMKLYTRNLCWKMLNWNEFNVCPYTDDSHQGGNWLRLRIANEKLSTHSSQTLLRIIVKRKNACWLVIRNIAKKNGASARADIIIILRLDHYTWSIDDLYWQKFRNNYQIYFELRIPNAILQRIQLSQRIHREINVSR